MSTKFKNATNSDTKTESAVKTSLIFLGAVGAATFAAHKFWPKGITYGDKEEWETKTEKKVKKAIRDTKDAVDDDSSSDEESGGRRSDRNRGGRGGGSDEGGRGKDGGGRGRDPSLNRDGRPRPRDGDQVSNRGGSRGFDARDPDRRPRNGKYDAEPGDIRGRSWDRQRPRDAYYDGPQDRYGGRPHARDCSDDLTSVNRQDYGRRGASVGAGYLTRREIVVKETERVPGGRAKSQLRERYLTSSIDRDAPDAPSLIVDRRRSGVERDMDYFASDQRYPAIEPARSTAGTEYSTRSVYRETEDEPGVVYVRRETSVRGGRPYTEAVDAGRSRSRYRDDYYR